MAAGKKTDRMRYKDTGQVHMDFHRTLNGTIRFLREKHGEAFLDDTFRRTARDVYRAIHEDLSRGDPEHLVTHWTFYLDREGGEYTLERRPGEIRLIVSRCPAIDYLRRKGIPVDPAFCRQTVVVNETLAEGTPFTVTTQVLGDGRCVQCIRRNPA